MTPVIGSLTASASSWLEEILRQVHSHYSLWLCSDPVTRLTIRQQAIEAGTTVASEARCALLSQRVTNLLLEAVPSAVKAEVVTVRALTPVGILFLLHTRYQPAGQAEKASILQFLVAPEVPKDSNAAIRGLRRWIRWLARATELQLSSPDASLLIKAVERLASTHLVDSSAVFRVQAFKLQHGVEHQPSQTLAVSLAQLYLAELETLQLSIHSDKKARIAGLQGVPEKEGVTGHGETGYGGGKGDGSRKGKGGKGDKSKGQGERQKVSEETKEACRQFSTDRGCPRGTSCPYGHDKSQGMKGRCFNCGGLNHGKAQCTSPGGGGVNHSSKAEAKSAARKVEVEASAEPNRLAASSGAPTLGPSATQALQDVAASITNTLKSLKALRRVASYQMPKKGLIDGGATACLRQTRSELEWESSNPIKMRLAVGDSEGIRQTPSGVLVTCQPVEPIVALHELIQLGYRMTYLKPGHIQVWKGSDKPLELDQSSGCPEVSGALALDLINQVEQAHLRRAQRVASLAKPISLSYQEAVASVWDSGDDILKWFRSKVPSIPARLLPDLAVPATTKGPWPRRMRRKWLMSDHVIVHLFAGKTRGKFQGHPWPVIEVDVEEDLHHPHTFGFLLGLAVQGRLAALVGGPPCKTYTAARRNDVGPNGPVPLRGVGEASYGLSTLSACEQVCVDRDTLLYLKFLLLACVGRQARLDLSMSWCSVLEFPEDPIKVFGSPQDGQGRSYPSWWRTPAWTEFAKVEPVTELSLDQGPLGHTRRKPTTLAVQAVGWALQPVRGPGLGPSDPSSSSAGFLGQSAQWAQWAPGLVDAICSFLDHQITLVSTSARVVG